MMFVSAAMAIASVMPPMRHMVLVSGMTASFFTCIYIGVYIYIYRGRDIDRDLDTAMLRSTR